MKNNVILITGTSRGIGRYLAEYYAAGGFHVIGCSRAPADFVSENYDHHCVDITDERAVLKLFTVIRKNYKRLDVLINNAGIASMNHALLMPIEKAQKILNTNVLGTFLFCREAAKLMKKNKYGRIINFTSVAVPFKVEGEAMYAASKAAVVTLTEILARELAYLCITVNAVGPTPIKTDLIRVVPKEKIDALIARQAINRFCELDDIVNVINFFMRPESSFITGQVIYLGGA